MRLIVAIADISTGDVFIITFLVVLICMIGFSIYLVVRKVGLTADKMAGTETHELSLRQTNSYELAIDVILNKLRIELGCADIYIGRFHNGGSFANGTRMKKFSVTYCKAVPTQKELVRWYMYDKFTSHWPEVFDQLYATGEYYCPQIEDSKDSNFRKDMQRFEFKSIYMYLICQPDIMNTPEGFVAVNYNCHHVSEFAQEERDSVKDDIPKLLALMNRIPIHQMK